MRRAARSMLLPLLLSAFLSCGTSRAAEPAAAAGAAGGDDARVNAFVNLTVNTTVIVTALMTEAMTGALGEVAAGMTEGAAGALDNGAGAGAKGEEMRRETARKSSEAVRELVAEMLPGVREQLGGAVAGLPPDRKKELLADLGDESCERAFAAIAKNDFGLPRLSERLSEKDILGYVALAKKDDPRLNEVMGTVMKMKEPRFVADMKRRAGEAAAKEAAAKEAATETVPPVIGKLPATYRFPPGAETTISLARDGDLKLSWEAEAGAGKSWENYGIMVRQGGSTVKTPFGGMTLSPEEGKITATVKNLEAFPVIVTISAEEEKP